MRKQKKKDFKKEKLNKIINNVVVAWDFFHPLIICVRLREENHCGDDNKRVYFIISFCIFLTQCKYS